jgi:hypothetical protein
MKQHMRTLFINLERRPDRLHELLEELSRFGITPERIPAIDGLTLTMNEEGRLPGFRRRQHLESDSHYRGAAACRLSHIKALREAVRGDVWPCLILEDDVLIHGEEPIELPETMKPLIYLGGLDRGSKGVYGAHAILYKTKEIAQLVLQYHEEHPYPVDYNMIRFIRLHDCCYFHVPYRFCQRDGFSDIAGKERTW